MIDSILAIVVPAYKPQFFQLALESIAAQTNGNIRCYIFDDAAPEEIKFISSKFPEFHYKRFDENMGRHDLVEHWHRCLEFIKEEWVWLFSDDDIMELNCVDEFYKALNSYPNATVFRFHRNIIDANNQLIRVDKPIKNLTGLEYIKVKLTDKSGCGCLQDHIFNWKKLREINGGFVNFPLAWHTDDATWSLLGKEHEIIAIQSAIVQIRRSGINISSLRDPKTLKRKFYAYMLFYLWSSKNFKLPLKCKLLFTRCFIRHNNVIPFSYYFQSPIFHSPIFILAILLIPVRKVYIMLKRFFRKFLHYFQCVNST